MTLPKSTLAPVELAARLREARSRLEAIAATLPDDGWIDPYRDTVNPPLWEYGHIVWFQEHWCLRLKPGRSPADSPLLAPLEPSRIDWADWRYNSSHIPHRARWQVPLPSVAETRDYGQRVLDAVCAKLVSTSGDDELGYYAELSLAHELMHTEAWWMMWQQRSLAPVRAVDAALSWLQRRIEIPAGTAELGSPRNGGFVFDNEKWAHPVAVGPCSIDARPVTCGEFAAFVDAGGYERDECWSDAGLAWRREQHASHPVYWRRAGPGWELRRFDRWIALPADEPVIHVCRHEAEAWARWRGRRLPTAAEWMRASAAPGFALGRCWEWTADAFQPYPGFEADPYADYSAPWFGTHCELRGAGSALTDPLLARATYRNFFMAHRRDPFAGFRTAR